MAGKNKKNNTPRVTAAEKKERISKVADMIIAGKSDFHTRVEIAKLWGIGTSMAKKYVYQARKILKSDDDEDTIQDKRDRKIIKLQNDLENMAESHKKTPQGINSIARMEKLIIKLQDLEPPKRHHVEATVTTTEMTREERDAYIKKMQEKVTHANTRGSKKS